MATQLKALDAEHLEALRKTIAFERRMVGNSKNVGLSEEAMLLLTKSPIWATCTVDNMVAIQCGEVLGERLSYIDRESRWQIALQAAEAFQAIKDSSDPNFWDGKDMAMELSIFLTNAVCKALSLEPSWLGDDGPFGTGSEKLLDLLRRHAGKLH